MNRAGSTLLAFVAATSCAPAATPPARSPIAPQTVVLVPPSPEPADPCATVEAWPPAPECVERLAAGPGETCLVTRYRAFCWSDDVRVIPRGALETEGLRMSGLRAVADGRSCALQHGVVTCQGEHLTTALHIEPDAPMKLPSGAAPSKVAVGPDHLCALTRDGAVHCQGDNRQGQLGDGSITNTYRDSVHAAGLPPAVDIVVGDAHSCALTEGGEVWCWGESPSPPGFVPPLAQQRWVEAHHAGGSSSARQLCLLSEAGEVACRGFVSHVFQPKLAGVRELAAMESSAYARNDQGQVWRWSSGTAPERVPILEPASELGPPAPCVRLAGKDELRCIRPEYGQRTKTYTPGRGMKLAAGPLVSSTDTTCGLEPSGVVRCWGNLGQDWRFVDTPPHTGPSLWMPHWAADDVISHVAKPMAGSRAIVELSPRGHCARDRRGQVWLLTGGLRHHAMRLELRTAADALGAVRLVDSNACVAARADGSLFRLEQHPGPVAMGPPPLPSPVVEELPGAEGAVQVELGYNLDCLRFEDGFTRCRWAESGSAEGSFDVALTNHPSLRIVIDGNEACALLAKGGLHCREVRNKTLRAVKAPMHHGSVRPLAVWPQ